MHDLNRYNNIYDTTVPILKFKTVKKHKLHIKHKKRVHITTHFIENQRQVGMRMDHCFINGRP